jgi:hypothetical protein
VLPAVDLCIEPTLTYDWENRMTSEVSIIMKERMVVVVPQQMVEAR